MLRSVAVRLLIAALVVSATAVCRPAAAAADLCRDGAASAASDTAAAEELTHGCRLSRDNKNAPVYPFTDTDLCSASALAVGETLTVTHKQGACLGTLYLRFDGVPPAFTITQYDAAGALIREQTESPTLIVAAFALDAACASVVLRADVAPLSLCDVSVYGPGALPESAPVWAERVTRTDFLVITTHADDEWLYLGAVYPIYGAERGYTGTFAYITTQSSGRLHEALNGLWRGGVRTYPTFLNFPDVGDKAYEDQKAQFREDEVTLALVRLYRQLCPLVVVIQDHLRGEYGHWQHILSANSAITAAGLAADPAYDPASAAEYGVWEPMKIYSHLAKEHPILLDAHAPLAAFDGKSAIEIARYAYRAHLSQQRLGYWPYTDEMPHLDIRKFGLVRTTVGYDTEGVNDMFEHIDPSLTVAVLAAATPTPTATPEPTPAQTQTPTPAPTQTPAQTPVSATAAQVDAAVPHAGWLVAAVVLLLACIAAAVFLFRRRRGQK